MPEFRRRHGNSISWNGYADMFKTSGIRETSLTACVTIRYQLKTPYSNRTTHVIFELLDFIAKLAVMVPKPRVNLTRFHSVFAPNSKYRHRAMRWAQRLKRVFNTDVSTVYMVVGFTLL
jgi:hypothetical protein